MARCLVTRRIVGPALERLEAAHEVVVWQGDMPPSAGVLRSLVGGAEGLLCLLTERVDRDLLEVAPFLRVVSNYAVGTDNVDLSACAERGIVVGRTPDVLTDATADLTWALILAVARRFPEATEAVRAGEWRTFEATRWLGLELRGATLGIVGYGRIGRAVAERAAGFGMEVVHGRAKEVLPVADVVSVHVPLQLSTRHLIDEAALRSMKPTAILVNTARGPIVDTEALRRALHGGWIAGAGLDVTDPEPLPATHPLLDAPNLLVVPHIGSATVRARERMTEIAVENLLAGLAGQELPHPA